MPRTKTMSVEQGNRINIDQYPSFFASGSIKGMKKLFYGTNAFLVKCGRFIYNVPENVYNQAY
jgi:hypothetical protein